MLHYFLQGAGRGGRKNKSCKREKVLVYILFNNSDVGENIPGNVYMLSVLDKIVCDFYFKACLRRSLISCGVDSASRVSSRRFLDLNTVHVTITKNGAAAIVKFLNK